MNTLTVTAHGCPNSFARRVQVDPTIAVELLREVRKAVEVYRTNVEPIEVVDAMAELSKYMVTLELLHNLNAK